MPGRGEGDVYVGPMHLCLFAGSSAFSIPRYADTARDPSKEDWPIFCSSRAIWNKLDRSSRGVVGYRSYGSSRVDLKRCTSAGPSRDGGRLGLLRPGSQLLSSYRSFQRVSRPIGTNVTSRMRKNRRVEGIPHSANFGSVERSRLLDWSKHFGEGSSKRQLWPIGINLNLSPSLICTRKYITARRNYHSNVIKSIKYFISKWKPNIII